MGIFRFLVVNIGGLDPDYVTKTKQNTDTIEHHVTF